MSASFGRGRRSAPTNRSRQQREQALQTAANQKAALSGSPLAPEQQLPAAPLPTIPDKAPKHELQQTAPETVTPEPEDPPAAVQELDKQEVELLVSLMQSWFVVIWFPCMNLPDLTPVAD